MTVSHPRFTVDTHLFRELGELLVGRDSTALVELVKNSYDADATECEVFGEHLGDAQRGLIRISDSGNGMTLQQFHQGFLRVASRYKTEGTRVSPTFRRRFTGAKGIGRLAAHKLAKLLELESIPRTEGAASPILLKAIIDWDAVERHRTLDDIDGSDAITVTSASAPRARRPSTT